MIYDILLAYLENSFNLKLQDAKLRPMIEKAIINYRNNRCHLFNKYLLNVYYVAGLVLGARDTVVNKTKYPVLTKFTFCFLMIFTFFFFLIETPDPWVICILNLFIYFIFGCVGSSFPCEGFL